MKFPGLLLCILIMTVMSPCMVRAESPDIDLNPVRVDPGPGRMAELTIRNGGRYAVSVESDSGASLQLVDRITGPGAVSGVPGKADGRLDLFLDPGTYRLRINGDIRDTHPVQIRVIRFEETGPEQRPLPDGEMETTELRDFQERDYWFTVSESRDLYIEAAGRALSDMRLWDEGVFLTRDMPSISASTTTPGQPLTVCRLFVSCTPGTYRLVLYGGQPQPWSVRAAMYPLYLRSGIPELPPAGAVNRSVSIFGEDLFKVSGEPDFFRLDSMVQDTGITVKSFTRDIYPWSLQSARTIQDLKQPYVNWRQTALEDEHLVRISGPAGAAYSFRWFKTLHTDDLGYPDTGPFDLHVVLGGRPRDLPDLNVILVEDSNRREIPPRIVVQSVTEISSDQPVFRRFNIEQPVSLYMDFKDNGSYRFESRGVQSRYILEPLQLVKPLDYVQPLPGPFPDTRDLPAGIYQMIILPDAPGALDLAVIAGEGPARWPASFQSETGRDGHAVLESITFSRDRSYRLLINRTGAPAGYGLLPAGRSGIEEAHVFSAGPETAPKMPAKALEMPILPLNRTVRMNLVPGSAGRMKCRIDQPGIYRLDLDTVEDAETEFRTLLKTTLEGWTRDDRHSVFQNTLIPGEYFLDYSVSDRYFGNFDVRITPVAIYDTGALRPGQTCRIDAGLPGIPSIQLGIEASDQYRVECGNVHTACPVRIETNDNWPAAALIEDRNTVLDLTPGTYRVIPMIRPENRAYRLTVTRLSEPDPVEGAGPHRLNLSEGGAGFWMDDPSIREHLWTFTVNASTRLSLILSDGMEGRLETPADPMRSPIAMIGTAAWSGHVRAGDYRLAVYPSIPDSMKPYHIKVRSDPLISGTRCSVDCPGKTGIALHHPPFASENAGQMLESVPALITVDGPVDTRAVLTDDAGKAVAVVDDVPGDLNPVILLPGVSPSPDSESGETAAHHILFIEPLNEDSTTCHAACIEPPVEVRQVPSDQSTVMTPGHAALQLMPMETSETDTWVVVTECAGVYGVLPGGIVSGRHLTVCPPGNPSLTLLDVDFRNQNISVFTRRHFVKFTAESSGKRNLRWDTVSIPGGSVFLGEYRVDRPGLFDTMGFFHLGCV
ncbi:MAG TPA: hypothetical protein PLV45_08270 [bacterium]|nr:hypothetical protein [bacterium]